MKRNAYYQGMFFWVRCLLLNIPSLTITEAVLNFMKNHGIKDGVDDNSDTLVREYKRIVKEYYEDERTKTD